MDDSKIPNLPGNGKKIGGRWQFTAVAAVSSPFHNSSLVFMPMPQHTKGGTWVSLMKAVSPKLKMAVSPPNFN